MSTLAHEVLLSDPSAIAAELPLGDELGPLGAGAGFPLVEDPRRTDRTSIIGMFVLRPAREGWTRAVVEGGRADSLHEVRDWCFNVRGVDGGWLIAGGNPFDAFRLALQYGLADAVIVGSNTVAVEGVDHGDEPGYLWQPYGPAAWPQLAALDPDLAAKIARVRTTWQALGVLSGRTFPAQIVVSQSGEQRPGSPDLLAARIFRATHPDGTPVETCILTSDAGAERLRARAGEHGLADRIDSILLPLSPPGAPEVFDIPAVPRALREHLDIRLANHDGGRTVLSKFSEAGVLPQINLTLMRGRSVFDVLAGSDRIEPARRTALQDEFETRRQLFFSGDHRLPRSLRPVTVLADAGEGVVVSFDSRGQRGL